MHPQHMTSPLVLVPETFTTMLTLVTLVVVPLLVADELLLSLEASPAVPLPAEERSDDVVLAMKPHGLIVNSFISTDPTGKVLGCIVTIPLMSLKCSRVDVLAAFLALNHFVRLLMTFQLTFVISCKAAAITPAGSTLSPCSTWPIVSLLLGFLGVLLIYLT